MTDRDPLNAFFDIRAEELKGQKPYEGGEHLWLGNAGAELAHNSLGFSIAAFGPFRRRFAPEVLTYGEIVAFSGDFYETPDALFDEKPSPVPWLYEQNDMSDLLGALREELAWIELPANQRGTGYPDKNIALWWNAKWFIELALRNAPHYGWHNAVMFAHWHNAALQLASQAAVAGTADEKSLLWRRAVFTNGFADHFLTDGFAAGHVRTPAAQIRSWGAGRGFDPKLSGALVKLIHDQDGHIEELHGQAAHRNRTEGLRVSNAHGDDWFTRCDGQMFWTGKDEPAVRHAVEAVADSVRDLLLVYNGAAIPVGVFASSRSIPFIHPAEKPLIEKFPATMDDAGVDRFFESIRWYVKLRGIAAGIRAHHIRECFVALPKIMEAFRTDIRQDATRPEVLERLDPAFIAAYKDVR